MENWFLFEKIFELNEVVKLFVLSVLCCVVFEDLKQYMMASI